jgi:hypothetical protein
MTNHGTPAPNGASERPRRRFKLVLDFGELPRPRPAELTRGQIDYLKRKARRAAK